jgi:hypothetical protein
MKTHIWIFLLSCFFNQSLKAQASFQRTFGGMKKENSYGVIATSKKGVLSVGFTESFGAGKNDIYLIRTDSAGNLEWAKTYGGLKDDFGTCIEKTLDNNYVILGYSSSYSQSYSDICLMKINEDGKVLWTKTYGLDKSEYSTSVKSTSDGGYIILGETINFIGHEKNSDILIIKTDANGNTQWSNIYGGNNTDYGYSIEEVKDGGYIVGGETNSYGKGEWDFYLLKIKKNGEVDWSKTFGDSKSDYGRYAIQSPDGGFIIGGNTMNFESNDFDFLIIKTDKDGNVIWSKLYGGAGTDYLLYMKAINEKGFLFTGYSNSAQSDMEDICLVFIDYSGKPLWTRLYGSPLHDYGVSLDFIASTDEIIIGGSTSGFGTRGDDILLIKTSMKHNQYNDCNLNFLYPFYNRKITPKESTGHYMYELHCSASDVLLKISTTVSTEQIVCTPEE